MLVRAAWLRLQKVMVTAVKGYKSDVTFNLAMRSYTFQVTVAEKVTVTAVKGYKPDVTFNLATWSYTFPVTSSPNRLQPPGLHVTTAWVTCKMLHNSPFWLRSRPRGLLLGYC